MVTHKEALDRAVLAWFEGNKGYVQDWHSEKMEAAIRSYLEARGLVMVPKDNGATFSDSELPDEMVLAGAETMEQCDADLFNGTGLDWDYGMQAVATYRAMLAAAPDPFGDAP